MPRTSAPIGTVGSRRAAVLAGETSIAEVVEAALERLAALEDLAVMRHVREREARSEARALDELLHRRGPTAATERPLLGTPITVKELTAVAGVPYSRGKDDGFPVAEVDAPAVRRLREAGCIVLGTTCCPADGWCAASLNGTRPPTRNPWNPQLTAGGSSAGAAVAVATGVGPAALGTDGAGSVRVPASFCGVVGYKPSFGRVPYVPLCTDGLSHLGVLARTVEDAATVAAAMAGPDPADPSTLPAHSEEDAGNGASPLRIAWAPTLGETSPSSEIVELCSDALSRLVAAGHTVEAIAPPAADPYAALVAILGAAEAQAVDARTSHPVREAVRDWGRTLTAADLAAALATKLELTVAYTRVFQDFDVLAGPTVPVPPFAADAPAPAEFLEPARDWLRWTPNTYVFNLTGQPAVTVPVGLSSDGLPVGLQVAAARGRDATALRAAALLEDGHDSREAGPDD